MKTPIFDLNGNLKCDKCKIYQPETNFYNNKYKIKRNGKSGNCKKCEKIRCKNKKIRRNNESIEYYIKDMCWASKRSAVKRNLEFSITKEFLLDLYNKQEGLCNITKIKMTHIRGQKRISTNLSVDRIDSKLGYTKDNIQLVCGIVNVMKYNLPQDELYFWCKAILNGKSGQENGINLPHPAKVNSSLLSNPALQEQVMGNVRNK